jgi:hypothetical protein
VALRASPLPAAGRGRRTSRSSRPAGGAPLTQVARAVRRC